MSILNKRKVRKSLVEARLKHKKFLASLNIIGGSSNGKTPVSEIGNRGSNPFPPTKINSSNSIPVGGGFKRSVDDYRWKTGRVESPATIEAIEAKRRMIAPVCNKGAYMLITDRADWKTAGRKV